MDTTKTSGAVKELLDQWEDKYINLNDEAIIEGLKKMFHLSSCSLKLISSLIKRLRHASAYETISMDNASLYAAPTL